MNSGTVWIPHDADGARDGLAIIICSMTAKMVFSGGVGYSMSPPQALETLDRVHSSSIVIDGLAGSAMNFEALLAGGVTACNVTLATSAPRHALDVMKAGLVYWDMSRVFDGKVVVVRSTRDIVDAKAHGKLGIILGTQGANCLEDDLDVASIFHLFGIRIMQLTYSERNSIGFGCFEAVDQGLTYFGTQVVRELNRLGVLIDLSHAGERTALEAVGATTRPVILSHSNPRAICENPRNVSDRLIRAVAGTGGVIGISTYSNFINDRRWPTLSDYSEHVAYVADLVGIDHVGIGTDLFEGRSRLEFERAAFWRYSDTVRPYTSLETRHAEGFDGARSVPLLTKALLTRGFDESDVVKIVGANFLRVFEDVWA